jgi:hypothetical protein
VSPFDATPQGRTTNTRQEDAPAPASLADELLQTRQHHPNLARGIVWADILADIAADEAARERGTDERRLPEAA